MGLPLYCDGIAIVLWWDCHCIVMGLPLYCDGIAIVLWWDCHCILQPFSHIQGSIAQ